MGERKGGQANGQSVPSGGALAVLGWLALTGALVLSLLLWGGVGNAIRKNPSPGREIKSDVLRNGVCDNPAIVDGERIWLFCSAGGADHVVRVDPNNLTAKDWLVQPTQSYRGTLRGFARSDAGAAVVLERRIFFLGETDMSTALIHQFEQEIIGLTVHGTEVRMAVTPFLSGEITVWSWNPRDGRTTPHTWAAPGEGIWRASSARARSSMEWEFTYLIPGVIDGSAPDRRFYWIRFPESEVTNWVRVSRANNEATFLDPASNVFPDGLATHFNQNVALVRLGQSDVDDWDFGVTPRAEKPVRIDFAITENGLEPLLSIAGFDSGVIRNGRFLRVHQTGTLDSLVRAGFDEGYATVASDWPHSQGTIVAPAGDGGFFFVHPNGVVAHVDASLHRTDPMPWPVRLWHRLRTTAHPELPGVLLFGYPLFGMFAFLYAMLTRKNVRNAGAVGATVWLGVAAVCFPLTHFFDFIGRL
jgi:hypothetical protein